MKPVPPQVPQIEEVADVEKCYQWLHKVGLKDGTEALIMAAQEQALSKRGQGLPHQTDL